MASTRLHGLKTGCKTSGHGPTTPVPAIAVQVWQGQQGCALPPAYTALGAVGVRGITFCQGVCSCTCQFELRLALPTCQMDARTCRIVCTATAPDWIIVSCAAWSGKGCWHTVGINAVLLLALDCPLCLVHQSGTCARIGWPPAGLRPASSSLTTRRLPQVPGH